MIYVLFPNATTFVLPDDREMNFTEVTSESLGGCFYDHICSMKEIVVGIRYYADREIPFNQHPVFIQFLHDKRFLFNQGRSFVDIFFEESCVKILEQGLLHVDCVQEFGGESIVKDGDLFGICLRLSDGTKLPRP